MRRQVTFHECDRCRATFEKPRDVALTIHASHRKGTKRAEFCQSCADAYESFVSAGGQ